MHNVRSPNVSDETIELEIQAKKLNAPRITPSHIDDQIVTAQYHVFPGTTVTVCCLTLRNGFNTVGKSACASPSIFDAEIGRKLAYDNARNQIWELEGYLLRDFLHANRGQFQELARDNGARRRRGEDDADAASIETSEREAQDPPSINTSDY